MNVIQWPLHGRVRLLNHISIALVYCHIDVCYNLAFTGSYGRCYLHFGNRSGQPSTEEDMNKVLEALNNLSLTITPPEKSATEGGATNGGEEGATDANNKPAPKVVNLNVQLIKYSDKAAKKTGDSANAAAPGAGAAATVNGGEAAAGGDASSARIESVDTTTV